MPRRSPGAGADGDLHLTPEMQFSYELRETSRVLLAALKTRLEPLGLTLTHFFLLRHLWDRDGINQSELSERLATTAPATVATLDALEKRGLVKRVRDVDDRRVARIFLTARGRAMRSKLLGYAHAFSVESLDGFSPADVATLRDMMRRVRENLERSAARELGA